MHCVDCHFEQDSHGDGKLYGETRNAIMIECVDCHGSTSQPANVLQYLKTRTRSFCRKRSPVSAKASATTRSAGSSHPASKTTAKLMQNSVIDPNQRWTVKQAADPNSRSRGMGAYGRRDGKTWGTAPAENEPNQSLWLAHGENAMSCYACHTSWNTSCFGCHLPMRANQAKPMLHNEGS